MERQIEKILKSQPTIEGAGVRLRRAFGYLQVPFLDPFLLLDHFGSENPEDYLKGFPWHPHRGIETVTYMWNGEVEHGDSIGNSGVIKSGDVQWMTAGSGIIHQEMPKKYQGLMSGFQLWVNLPAKEKMTSPKYRGIQKDEIPTFEKDGIKIRVLAGKIDGIEGPVRELAVKVEYLDIELAAGKTFEHLTDRNCRTFAYIINGSASARDMAITPEHCAVFTEGDLVRIGTKEGTRLLLVTGEPLKEPVAWGGPIVMNTRKELATAFRELDEGTFIKTGKLVDHSRTFYRS
jgi:redox-sensitive bicupin YhaK (pirin superfamily)